MDQLKISEILALHPYGALTVNDVTLLAWGRDLAFTCVYDPGEPGQPVSFRLTFKDCRDIRWRTYTHAVNDNDPDTMPPTPVVNITLGSEQHRKPAHILTDYFGLSVLYGALVIARDEAVS